MKKNLSRLKILAIVSIIIISVLVLKDRISNILPKNETTLINLKKEDINQMVITNNNSVTTLQRKDRWYVVQNNQTSKADQDRLNTLLTNIYALKKEEIVSNNKNKQKDFGIETNNITLKTNNATFKLYIGNNVGLEKNYLRINNENDVFIGSGLQDVFTSSDFRDLNLNLVASENAVNYVELSFDKNTLVFQKKGNNWTLNEKPIKREAIDYFVNELKILKANDIITDNQNNLSQFPNLKIKIKESDKEKVVDFFIKDQDNYLAKIHNDNNLYQISTVYVNSLKKQEKDFIE